MNFREQIELSAKDNASNVIRGVVGNLRGLVGQVAAMAGVAGGGALFGAMVKEGLGFQKMLEDSRIAIAGVIGALHTYRDASGNAVKGERAWAAALADSAQVQEKLRTAALTTTATYAEMVEGFTTGIGPMSRAGIALTDTVEATQRLTQVAAAASLPMAQLAVEIRQFFNGDVMRSRLLQTLQITKEQIEEHKKLGDMMDFIREKTESYARAAQAAAETMTGRWSNLKDAIQQTLGVGMEPLHEKLKEAMGDVTSQFVTFGKDDKGNLTAQFSPEMIARVQAMGEHLASAVERFKELLPAVVDFGLAMGEHISKAIDLLSQLPLKPILEVLTDLVNVTNGWGLAIAGVVYAAGGLGNIAGVLGTVLGLVKSIGASVATFAAGIETATGLAAGLSGALATVGTAGLFAAALWGITKIIEGLRATRDLLDELDKEKKSTQAGADAMLLQLQHFRDRMASSGMADADFQSGNRRAWELTNAITNEMKNLGQVTSITRDEYSKFLKDMKTELPPAAAVPGLTRETNHLNAEIDEARAKWAEFVQKVKDKAALSAMDGLRKKMAELAIAERDAIATAQKNAGEAGANADAAVETIRATYMNERVRAAAKEQGRVYASVVLTGTQAALAKFNGGEALVEQMFSTLARRREEWQAEIEKIFRLAPDDAGAGARAGMYGVFAALPSAAESAANAVRDVWASMARSFDDLFFNVLSGRFDSLKDIFKSLGESLLQTFSRYLSDMLQRWLATQAAMSQTGYTGKAFNVTSYGPNGGVTTATGRGTSAGGGAGIFGYLGAAGTGWGIGSGIGKGGAGNQWGGAVGAIGGLAVGSMTGVVAGVGSALGLGAAAGSVVPIIGTIVGAIIGAIIGGVFNKNTEKHIKSSLSNIVPGTYQSWVGGSRDPETGQRTPGYWQTLTTTPRTSFERESFKVIQSQTATMADLFQLGAKDDAKALLGSYTSALRKALTGAHVDIAAGSDEDLQKDYEYFLGTMLPRIGLSAAFGQTGYLPHGNRDKSGGVQGIDWWAPGMDKEGNWIEKQLYSTDSPMYKFLVEGLGFTVDKFAELAGRISTDDPAKLLEYIQGIVGVVVGLRDLGVAMGKTFEQLAKGWAEESSAGPIAKFKSSASDLVTLFEGLTLYSGDEQLKKAQEAQSASSEFWSSVVEYLKDVQAAIDEMSGSITAQRVAMREFLSPVGEGSSVSNNWSVIAGTWGKLATAVDPAAVQEIVAEAQSSIDAIFSVMAERVTRGKALVERLTGLRGSLWDIGRDVAADAQATANPLAAWGGDLVEIQRQIADAARLSGTEQIAAIEDVAASAETLYGNLRSLLSEIASVSASLSTSFEKQIWELGVGEMEPAGQATAITDRIKLLQEQLKVATSPAEIQSIASEIQSLTTRYVGTFGEDDAKRDEAIAWAQEQLARANGLAQETLAALKAQAEAQAAELSKTLSTATGLISANVTEAATIIGQLSFTLGELERVMRETMTKLGTDLLDSLAPLREAMANASGIFTGAVQASGTALAAPETGFEARITSSTAALGTFEGALLRLASRMDGLSGGVPVETSTTTPPTSRVTPREVVPIVKRYSKMLAPRVA